MTAPSGGVIPHLVVADAAAAIDLYASALDAREVMRVPAEDGKRLLHAEIEVNGALVYLRDHFPEFESPGCSAMAPPSLAGSTGVTLHLDVADCDAAVARAGKAGFTVHMPPEDAFWGARYASMVDPFGHCWSFSHMLAGAPD